MGVDDKKAGIDGKNIDIESQNWTLFIIQFNVTALNFYSKL